VAYSDNYVEVSGLMLISLRIFCGFISLPWHSHHHKFNNNAVIPSLIVWTQVGQAIVFPGFIIESVFVSYTLGNPIHSSINGFYKYITVIHHLWLYLRIKYIA